MARHAGKYYVRKKWRDGHCISEYIGAGQVADALEQLDAAERARREEKQAAWRWLRESEQAIDSQMLEAIDVIRMLTRATLIATGYHTHKGQWRKRRG
jgi:macrodomain Ter protein organizer (MatP/YcbG family)